MVDPAVTHFDFDRIDRRTKQVTPALISAVVQRIVAAMRPRRVILFGSQARGKVGGRAFQDSDIDLLVCLDDRHPLADLPRSERSRSLLDLFRYRSFGLDVIVLTEGEVQHLQDTNEGEWDLILEILDHGKVLYEHRAHIQA